MIQIERLRTLAREAIAEYQASLMAGGEPLFPQWADDVLAVCDQAEAGMQASAFAASMVKDRRRSGVHHNSPN